jgi:hypothetical protein
MILDEGSVKWLLEMQEDSKKRNHIPLPKPVFSFRTCSFVLFERARAFSAQKSHFKKLKLGVYDVTKQTQTSFHFVH